MDTSLSISCVRLETVKAKERKYSRIIRTKFRPLLLAFQKGLHKAKKVLTSRREDQNIRREWAELNIELLHLISKKMESISNFIIFRAVCKDWRLATDPTDAPAQLPWLIWPTVPKETRVTDPRHHPLRRDNEYFVYSLSSKATQRIRLTVNNVPIGMSSAGFMLVFEYPSSIFFLNVITGAKVTLSFLNPPLHCIIQTLGHSFSHNSSIVDTEIFLFVSNLADIGFNTKTMKYQFVRFQPPNTIKRISIILPKPAALGYYKGRIFASIRIQRATWVYDASSGTKTSIEIPHPGGCVNFNFNFLINAMGDLFGVRSYVHSSWKFEVYRLEHTDDFGCCRWSKMNGIGDRVLFLQDDYYGFCLMANDIKGHKGNYIYYKEKSFYGYELFTGRICRYDIGDGTTERLGMTSPEALWFVPSLC